MRILFTGPSSFTGAWFVRTLAARGHDVLAVCRGSVTEGRDALRAERLRQVAACATLVGDAPFGSEAFLAALTAFGTFDVLCHHAAETTNYKSLEFDAVGAVAANTLGLPVVLQAALAQGLRRLVLTGSVFEAREGAGSAPMGAFSPYGLSKTMTSDIVAFQCHRLGCDLGKFVIANPFGPWEEPRFTSYLIDRWRRGETAVVATPAYVRDNVPASLLATAYADFVERLADGPGFAKLTPTGYAESQGSFAHRFAREMGPRLGLSTPLELKPQTEFPEPAVRIATDLLDTNRLGWSESVAWDDMADYYARQQAVA